MIDSCHSLSKGGASPLPQPKVPVKFYYDLMMFEEKSFLSRGSDAVVIESLKLVKTVPSFHSYWREKMQTLALRRPSAEVLEGDFFFLTGEPSRQVMNVLVTVLNGSPFSGSSHESIILCARYMVEYMFVDERMLEQQIFFVESRVFMEELEKAVFFSSSFPLSPPSPPRSVATPKGGGRKVMKASISKADDNNQFDDRHDKEALTVQNIFDLFLPNHDLKSGKNGVLCLRAGFAGCFRGLPPSGFSKLRQSVYKHSVSRIYILPKDAPHVVLEAMVDMLNGKDPERFYQSDKRLRFFRPIVNAAIEYMVENIQVSKEDIDSFVIHVPNECIMRNIREVVEKHTGSISVKETSPFSCSALGGGGKKVVCRNKDDDDETLCVICFRQLKDTVFLPCSHLATCSMCAEEIFEKNGKCCICCQETTSLLRVYGASL